MRPGATTDAEIDSIAPLGALLVSTAIARSGLRVVQCAPPSLVATTRCMPASSSFCPCHRVHTSGSDEVKRGLNGGAMGGPTSIHVSAGLMIFVTPIPLEYTVLGSD